MSITLEALGFTKEELQQRVIDQLCEQILHGYRTDDDSGEDSSFSTSVQAQLRQEAQKRINEAVQAIGEKYILPNVTSYLEALCLQETTKWGEKKGEPITFIEYLTKRAEHFMNEQVDGNGKGKSEGDSYHWTGKQSRITHLIHAHLQYNIETAMKNALSIATSAITSGITETVKLKLAEVQKQIQVNVKTQ